MWWHHHRHGVAIWSTLLKMAISLGNCNVLHVYPMWMTLHVVCVLRLKTQCDVGTYILYNVIKPVTNGCLCSIHPDQYPQALWVVKFIIPDSADQKWDYFIPHNTQWTFFVDSINHEKFFFCYIIITQDIGSMHHVAICMFHWTLY